MKRQFVVACVIGCLLAIAVLLVGCSSNASRESHTRGSESYSRGSSAHGATGERARELEEELVGFWSLAGKEKEGLKVYQRSYYDTTMSVKENGTAYIMRHASSIQMTWEASGEDDITFYHETYEYDRKRERDEKAYVPMKASYDPEENIIRIDGTEYGIDATLLFCDAISYDLEVPSLLSKNAQAAISDKADVLGNWGISGAKLADEVVVGEEDAVAEWLGIDGNLEFKRDGTGILFGKAMSWSIEGDSCTITQKDSKTGLKVIKADDDKLLIRQGGNEYQYTRYQ